MVRDGLACEIAWNQNLRKARLLGSRIDGAHPGGAPRIVARDTRRVKPRVVERSSAKRANPFYLSSEWQALRAEIIAERGWRCEDSRCPTPRGPWKQIYGDHIVEIVDGGARPISATCCCAAGAATAGKRSTPRSRGSHAARGVNLS